MEFIWIILSVSDLSDPSDLKPLKETKLYTLSTPKFYLSSLNYKKQ